MITSILEELAASIRRIEEKTETAGYTEMLATTYKITCCHNPEDHSLNFHFHENLKSHTCIDFVRLVVLKKVEKPDCQGYNLAKNVHVSFE
jgi:hypothetical protein